MLWFLAASLAGNAVLAQSVLSASLSGTVMDRTGAVLPGAPVHLSGPGLSQETLTDRTGRFSFTVPPGTYTLRVDSPGFVPYTSSPLLLKPHAQLSLPLRLAVEGVAEHLDVTSGAGNSTDPNDNASALVFEGDRLNLLSDDNATLKQQLQALAGPGIGGAGMQIFVNGFSGGTLPPKSSIRSIRISKSDYSPYYDSLGFGRVEIETKPGTDKFHGGLNFSGTDQPFNASNPYASLQPPYYQFQTDGNLNGPLNKKTSFFVSENIQILANNAVVNAFNPDRTSDTLSEALPAPQHTDTFSLRLDRQISTSNFGYIRDEWSQTHITNSGIAPLVLPSAAFAQNTLTNTLQASDTQVFGPHAVNEARFQYLRTRTRQDPNSTATSVTVEGAFQNGGSPAQVLRDNQDRYELDDVLDLDRGKHSIRAGFRFRELRDANESDANFNGQYTFANLGAYQITQQGLATGLSGAQIRALGGGPSQFSITAGRPSAALLTDDFGLFAEDDWKATKNLTLSYGLRLESQSAIPDHFDPAPRVGFAWAVHHGKSAAPVVTLRGGYGIFYDRFPALNILQAIRENGQSELGYFVQNPDFYPNLPAPSTLPAIEPTIYRVNPALRSSYSQTGSVTVDRTIGKLGLVSATYVQSHGTHGYLSQDVNAPLPGTFDPARANSGVRPLGTAQNIYQYNSDSNENDEAFFANANLQLTKKLYFFSFYVLDRIYNESAGSASFPSNQYNVAADYARASGNHLQTVFTGLMWTLPHGFQVQPFFNAHSGAPFDITTGTDRNGDTIFNDRPAFATDLARASVVRTAFGNFDVAPQPGQEIIPRNYGNAPGFAWLDLQASKDFHIGPRAPAKANAPAANGKPAPPAKRERPWDLKFQVDVQNLFNRNNPGLPVGVLPSPGESLCTGITSLTSCSYFGRSLSLASDYSPLTASNRTILFQSFFTF